MRTVACDRCGEFIKADVLSMTECSSADMVIFAKSDCFPEKRASYHLDLCAKCKASFIEWLGIDLPVAQAPDPIVKPKTRRKASKKE